MMIYYKCMGSGRWHSEGVFRVLPFIVIFVYNFEMHSVYEESQSPDKTISTLYNQIQRQPNQGNSKEKNYLISNFFTRNQQVASI